MILIVDGTNALMRRATSAPDLSPRTVAQEVSRQIARAAQTIAATEVIIAFDSPTSWRVERYPAYKASRTGEAGKYTKSGYQVLRADGWTCVGASGFEADDVIATLATGMWARSVATLSSDNDLLALASDRVTPWLYGPGPRGEERAGLWIYPMSPDQVRIKFGIPEPKVLPDLQAMVGGKNDVPGVPGIGKVRAGKLLTRHGTLLNIITQEPEVLGEHASHALFARSLLRLRTDAQLVQ